MNTIVLSEVVRMRTVILLEFRAGTSLDDATKEALDRCIDNKKDVEFDFNGIKYELSYSKLLKSFSSSQKL